MLMTAVLAAMGCGHEDPNKDLKPVNPNMAVMKNSGGERGGATPDKTAMPAK